MKPVVTLATLLADVDAQRRELLGLWQNLIRFPTVNTGVMPTGFETPCAEYLAATLDRDGLRAQMLESAPRRGNCLAEWPGDGDGPTLLLMGHLDVVPPGDESRWTYPPFEAVERDGWVHGRGANDCKGLVAAEVMALLILARRRCRLPGAVKLAACADEEAGGAYGFGWVAEHHPDLLRADLGINEGGGGLTRLGDGRLACLVAVGEKGRLEARLTLYGSSHHASAPWLADNPLDRLGLVLGRLREYRPEIHVAPIAEQIQALWGEPAPPPGELDAFLAARGASRATDVSRLRGQSRMTWVATMLQAGEKSNAIPDRLTVTADVRTLPGQSPEYVREQLQSVLGDIPGLEISLDETAACNATALTPATADLLSASFAAVGEEPIACLPSLCAGFTDARLVRPLGVPVLGFAPMPQAIDQDRCGCHNIDEQFPFAAVVYRTKLLLALAWLHSGLAADAAR